MRVFLLDNYDSFTYNLVQLLARIGADVTVARNDQVTVAEVEAQHPDAIVISPGPSRPEKAGISVELVQRLGPSVPILGVCLGHQAIGVAYGAQVMRVPPVHGKARPVHHAGLGSFDGLPSPIDAARYHSLAISTVALPDELEVTAWSEDGVIMAIRHRSHPVEGFQFHPESILTEDEARRSSPDSCAARWRRRGRRRSAAVPSRYRPPDAGADHHRHPPALRRCAAALADIVAAIADAGGTLRTLSTPRVADDIAEAELEVAGLDPLALAEALANVRPSTRTRPRGPSRACSASG